MLERYQELLATLIEEEVGRELKALASGNAQDYAEYRFRVGVIAGLSKARDYAMEEARKETLKG